MVKVSRFFTKTIFASLLICSTSIAMDPVTRLEKVKELFTQYGLNTFPVLNGQGYGGTGVSESGKSSQTVDQADIMSIINSADGNAFIFCVADSKWTVYPPEPMKVGTDAMSVTDADGKPFVGSLIDALRKSPDGKASHVPYTSKTPDGRIEKREATVWNSKNLLSRKNDTGQKFFCGTSINLNR